MSKKSSYNCHETRALAPIVKELEAALLEYVELYGPTDRARSVLIEVSKFSEASMISGNYDPLSEEKS